MDKRAQRLAGNRIFSKSVTAYRTRPVHTVEPSANLHARVFVRARPLFEHEAERNEWDCVTVNAHGHGVVVHEGTEMMKVGGSRKYMKHHTFPQLESITTDEEGYTKLRYLVEGAAHGRRSTLFMYGMTGSGKTYSTNLLHEACPTDLLHGGAEVELLAYELVGKRAFDLLSPEKQQVHVRVGGDGATHVYGTTIQRTGDAEELTSLLKDAAGMRETASTGTNATSSRSHAVYQLRLSHGGSLTIIDLAGNEGNIETFNHSREQMVEAAEINMSLMVLKNCLHTKALGEARIPYRESVLTRVLRDALTEEGALTACVTCVSPACTHFEHSLNTLKTAWCLMGNLNRPKPEEEVLREAGIKMGGPMKWAKEDLQTWLAAQTYASAVELPTGMSGSAIMRLTVARLAAICGEDQEVAKQLFVGLREAAKQAAKKDRQNRAELKAESNGRVNTTVNLSMVAPRQPIVAANKH